MNEKPKEHREMDIFIDRIWDEFEKFEITSRTSGYWYAESLTFQFIYFLTEELGETQELSTILEKVVKIIGDARREVQDNEKFAREYHPHLLKG